MAVISRIALAGVFACCVTAYGASITLETSASALGANDSLTWTFLGSDGSSVPQTFTGTTALGNSVGVSLTGNQGLVAVVGSSWGPASGAFTNGDTLLWAYDNSVSVNAGSGPVSANFPADYGVGAAVQADAPGAFTASLQLFNGTTSLETVTESSDSAGDAIFIGALTSPLSGNVTSAIFGLTASGGDNNDFALDTLEFSEVSSLTSVPEPSKTVALIGMFAGLYLLWQRRLSLRFATMRKTVLPLLCAVAVAFGCDPAVFGQQIHVLKGTVKGIPTHNLPIVRSNSHELTATVTVVAKPLPMWTYSIVAYDGKTYTGTILGVSPYNRGKTTTTIPVQIIPLAITINDSNGSVTYDPTAVEPTSCVPGNHTGTDIIVNSPIFTNNSWTMNGVDMGTTQYEDANVRAEFWSLLQGSPYHLLLKESTLASQTLSFTYTSQANYTQEGDEAPGCEGIGVVKTNDMDTAIQNLINGPLSGLINVSTFPLFLTRNVVMSDTDTNLFGAGCCTLGFHSSFTDTAGNLQLYGPFVVDTANAFGPGYTDVMAHEVGEGIHDPNGLNPIPPWGNQGQVAAGSCQDNFEVGDPLSNGGVPPTSNEWIVNGANGLTYDLQELAFYSWFYGGPSLGAGGYYSNNKTFLGFAKPCPPGGTN